MLRHYFFGILNTQRTHTCKYGHVASSTHSVRQVEAQKKVCEKIKSVVRGSERVLLLPPAALFLIFLPAVFCAEP